MKGATDTEAQLKNILELCRRQQAALGLELRQVDGELRSSRVESIEAVTRLQTIPGVGVLTATTIYAWIGDVRRFANAILGAYAGLVPQVRQSGAVQRLGSITKTGSKPRRATLIQAASVVMYRCRSQDAEPLNAIAERVRGLRARRKIAVIALARHLLRIAYYVLRDETTYEWTRIGQATASRRAVA